MATSGTYVWVLALGITLTGCGGAASTAPPPTAAPPVASAAAVTRPADPAPTAATPSATAAALPSVAQDKALVKKAVVTTDDLGKPWFAPTSVSTVKNKKGELCPGHADATAGLKPRASAVAKLTEGKGVGRNILTVAVATLPSTDAAALQSGLKKNLQACGTYTDANGLFVVTRAEGPTTVAGVDEVLSASAERIYLDKAHTRLGYVRHNVAVRKGRVETTVSYAFLAEASDPKAKSFRRLTKLLTTQLAKNDRVFTD